MGELQRLQRQHELILNAVREGIYGVDQQGAATFVNAAAVRMTGYSVAELLGQPLHPLLHHAKLDTIAGPEGACSLCGTRTEDTVHQAFGEVMWRKDGSSFPAEYTHTPIREGEQVVGAVVVFRDITTRKQAEEALRQSEARYRAVFDQAPIGMDRIGLDGRAVETNSALQTMLGYSADELRGLDFAKITHPDDLEVDEAYFQELVEGKRDHYLFDKRYLRKDGEVLWATVSVSLIRDAAGAPQFVIGMVEDITERKRSEATLREHEAHTRELAHARQIQEGLLPATLSCWPGQLELAVRFRAARETSGDFYDVFALAPPGEDGVLAPLQLVVGDVAGKGLSAALVMAEALTTFRAIASRDGLANGAAPPSPAATMRQVNGLLHRYSGAHDFVACALAVIEPPDMTGDGQHRPRLRIVNAAQVPPLLCRDGQARELEPPGERLPLGVLPDPQYDELVVGLQPGDVVVFASDGLPEAPARADQAPTGITAPTAAVSAGEYFGFERLAAAAAAWSQQGDDAEAIAAGLWAELAAWCGESSQHDDMTLLVLRVPPVE